VGECPYCGIPYDPTESRWRCPSCGFKDHCCEGAPLDVVDLGGGLVVPLDELLGSPDETVSLDELVAGGYDFPEDDECASTA